MNSSKAFARQSTLSPVHFVPTFGTFAARPSRPYGGLYNTPDPTAEPPEMVNILHGPGFFTLDVSMTSVPARAISFCQRHVPNLSVEIEGPSRLISE